MDTHPSREQLELLAESRLGPADRAVVVEHVERCEACRETLAVLAPFRPTKTWANTEPVEPETSSDTPLPEEFHHHTRYRVFSLLGGGGMGTVYKAEHRLLERPVVLKVIRSNLVANPGVVQRFQKEARLAARLHHPNVVAVYEAEEFGATQMLVMEYVEGVNLAELVAERGLLPVPEACEIVRQAAVGLDYIGEQGLIHRDIKPANLLVSRSGHVKILDLGVATLKGDPAVPVADMTGERQFVGTVDYASPEQWESSRNLDIRADVYSLGCTFYYLLAGEAPFPNKKYTSLMQQMWAHSQAPLPPIRALRPDVPPEIAAVLARMLAKSRDDRYARPGEVAAALAPFTQDCDLAEYARTARRTTTSKLDLSQVSSVPKGPPPPAPSRRGLVLGVVGVAALAAAVAVAFGPWGNRRSAAVPPDPVPPAPAALKEPPIKVGVLHSRKGTMAISERPVIEATLLAIDEVNEKGGVLGHRVEAVVEDGESNAAAFAAKAEKLITQDGVRAVFGCWTSASRKTARPVFERHDHLLFYPVQYEGLEQSPNIVYTGAAPNQQIIPAVNWCVKSLHKKRFFLVGSDYVFPRTANAIIRDQAKELGAEVVGEEYLLLRGSSDIQAVVRKIAAARPDAILNTINGDNNVPFFRALRAAGITSADTPTVSFSISEEELSNLDPKDVAGDYAAWSYFQSVDRPQNREFVKRFQARHGSQRVLSDPMDAAYSGVHLWAQAVREAGDATPPKVRPAVRRQTFDAPGGVVRIDPDTQHATKFLRVGRITAESRFEVRYDSEAPSAPMPYPNTRSKADWDGFLMNLRLGWGGAWENPGR